MMGWRSRLKGGFEYDALTPWRRFLGWNAGVRAWIKHKHNKRIRREAKEALRDQ